MPVLQDKFPTAFSFHNLIKIGHFLLIHFDNLFTARQCWYNYNRWNTSRGDKKNSQPGTINVPCVIPISSSDTEAGSNSV